MTKTATNVKGKENIKKENKAPLDKFKEPEKDIIPEKKTAESAPAEEKQPIQVMSDGDSSISNLVKEATPSLPDIKVISGKAPNLLALPEECEALHGKTYRFRWLANDKRLRSKLQAGIWTLCTKLNSSFMKKERFKSHGAVEQSGMLLAFCKEEVAKIKERIPADKSAALVKHYTEDIHKQDGNYRPENAGGDDEEGLTEGVDF